MDIAKRLERFFLSANPGRLWVVVSWADVTGVAWLGGNTPDRSVILIVDDTRPHIFARPDEQLSPELYDAAIRFLERPDVEVKSVIRRHGTRVHRKLFLIESQQQCADSALVGSPNLSKYGLFCNEETLVLVSPDELPEVWDQTTSLLERARPAEERLASYIRNAQVRALGSSSLSASSILPDILDVSGEQHGDDLHSLLEDWPKSLGVEPCHVRSSANDVRRTLFGWERLNDVLTNHRLEFPRLRVVQREQSHRDTCVNRRGGTADSPDSHYIESSQVYQRINEGGTLVLSGIQECDRHLDEIHLALQQRFGIRIGINMYMSLKPERGFGLHWDAHDVVIVQIEGQKDWTVYRPTRRYPLDRDIDMSDAEEPTEAVLRVLLEPGDVLYIPRGWWHDVIATDSPSLHLTIGLEWRTIADYLYWQVDRMLAHDIVRQDIPFDSRRREADVDVVAGILLHELDPGSGNLDRYLRESTAAIRMRPSLSLPFGLNGVSIPDNAVVQSRCSGLVSIESGDDEIICEVDDQSFSLPIICASLVRDLLDCHEIRTVGAVRKLWSDEHSKENINRLLIRFASYGLIRIKAK